MKSHHKGLIHGSGDRKEGAGTVWLVAADYFTCRNPKEDAMSTTMIHVKKGGEGGASANLTELLIKLNGVSSVTPRQAGLLLVSFEPTVLSLRNLLDAAMGAGYHLEVVDL